MKNLNKYYHIHILTIAILFVQSILGQTVTDDFNRAMDAYNNQIYSDAQKIFQKVIDEYGVQDELYASARFYSANSLLKMGKRDESIPLFEFIVNNIVWSKFREESLINLGLIYFAEKRFASSRKNFLSLMYDYPENEYVGSAMYWIGESYVEEGKHDEAVDFFTKAIEDKSGNTYRDHSLYALASVYEKQEDYINAVKYYDQLLTYYPNSSLATQAQVRIGVCYYHLKDYQTSILELNNPIINDLPDEHLAEALYLLANSHYRVEEYDDAAQTYSEITRRFPETKIHRIAQYGLAWSLFQQSNYSEAYTVFNNLSEGEDTIAIKSFIWKGESKRYSGDLKEALIIFEDFLRRYPNDPSVPVVENLIGLIYFEQNNFDLSSKHLMNATSSDDPVVRAKAFTMIGEIEMRKKNYIKARGNFEPAVKITQAENKVHLRALLGLGVSLYHLGEFENALGNLREAENIDPAFEQDKINFYMAESYFSLSKYQEALSRYSSIQSTEDEYTRQVLYSKGYSYFNLGSYDNAAYQFAEFIEQYPNDSRAMDAKLRLADSYFGSKNYAAASKIFKQIFQSGSFSSDDPYTYYQYAQALYKSGETNSAINEFRSLQQKFPSSKYAESSLFTIGFIRFQNGEYEESIEDYRNVLHVYKNSSLAPAVYYSIGDAYFNLGNYNSAIENYQIVLSRYPSSEYVYDAINGIQYCYVAMDDPESAVELIDNFTAQNPNLKFSDQIFFKKGEIYYSQRDYHNAKASYQEFLIKYPKSSFVPEAYYWLGKSSQNLKQDDEAISFFNKVFESYPNSESAAVAVIELGKLYEVNEDYQSSITLLEKASVSLKDSPRFPEILFLKGTAYIKANDFQKAYSTFEELAMYHRETLFADKAKFEMGMIDLAAQRHSVADRHFLEVAEKRTDDLGAKSQYHYGLSLYEQNKITESISALVRVKTVYSIYDEWVSRSYLLLGDCYVKLNENRKAEEMYRVVIAKHKGDELGEVARQKINNIK